MSKIISKLINSIYKTKYRLCLRNTYIITLPREIANLSQLLILDLNGYSMKETLSQSYSKGMA